MPASRRIEVASARPSLRREASAACGAVGQFALRARRRRAAGSELAGTPRAPRIAMLGIRLPVLALIGPFLLAPVAGAAVVCSDPDFIPFGDLPGGLVSSQAFAITADGTAAVGVSESASGTEAFRIDEGMPGLTALGDLAGGRFASRGLGVSGDGAVAVGVGTASTDPAEGQAVLFEAGVVVGLGDLAGGDFGSIANDVSDDGLVIVGAGHSASGEEAFRWFGGVMTGLGDLAGGAFESRATAVSADGAVVVGRGASAAGQEAFRWTGGVMTGLGDLAGGAFESVAYDVAPTGLVVVGGGHSASGEEAFRWTPGGHMVGLGDLAGGEFSSAAFGVSANGRVIVGGASDSGGQKAFYWTQRDGMRSLRDVLEDDCGIGEALLGWHLVVATGVSDDGRRVVGYGTNPEGDTEAWAALLPEPSSLALGVAAVWAIASLRASCGARDSG